MFIEKGVLINEKFRAKLSTNRRTTGQAYYRCILGPREALQTCCQSEKRAAAIGPRRLCASRSGILNLSAESSVRLGLRNGDLESREGGKRTVLAVAE
jgi:hypothetical protein